MTPDEKKALAEQIGQESATKINTLSEKVDAQAKNIAEIAEANKGYITDKAFKEYQESTEALVKGVKDIAEKQGTELAKMQLNGSVSAQKDLGVGEFLHKNSDRLKAIKKGNGGSFEFMITADKSGQFHAVEVETKDDNSVVVKTVGPHATIDAVAGAGNVGSGNVGSIFQSFSAAAILRTVSNADINSIYRNTSWLFPVLGLEQVGMDNRVAFYFDEEPKVGGSATVAEGVAKPYVQYGARLRNADYRKRAVALEFTQEFQMDFNFLETYFLGQARIDLYNDIQTDVYSRLLSNGVAYTSGDGTNFKTANGGVVAGVNNYDVLVAMAAKVNKNTFGANANGAIMSTEKAAATSITKDSQYRYVGRPEYINNMTFVENPEVGVDDVLVGDFSQYKLQMRGGIIVRAGLNGNNLIENKMTYVMEQFYFDYISARRTAAIVKGTTFAAVKTLIGS